VRETVLSQGYIGEADLRLFQRVETVDQAVESIDRFYRRYHSLRYVGNDLVIRLNSAVEPQRLEELKAEFSDILASQGEMCCSDPLPAEMDEPEISHLSRMVVKFNRKDFARLKEFIDAINSD
jgi:hypothetical protein